MLAYRINHRSRQRERLSLSALVGVLAAPFNKATVRYRPEIARTLAPRPLETLIQYQIRATPATAAAHRDCYVSDVRLRETVVFDQRDLPLQGIA